MSESIQSRPHHFNPTYACEQCVYGTGEHAEWCPEKTYWEKIHDQWQDAIRTDMFMPRGDILMLVPRRKCETESEWAKRCAVIKNVGMGEPWEPVRPLHKWAETAPCNCNLDLAGKFPELEEKSGHQSGCPKHILWLKEKPKCER